ncbi:MAG TPA: hypothetical protein VMH02_12525 [Verrucomicrobiae bacterium]|nr:hypothetical protein [Verrucomicrobiae bacterium]
MNVGALATDLALGNVAQGVTLGTLSSVLSLEQAVGAQLAASIGLGAAIDAYA